MKKFGKLGIVFGIIAILAIAVSVFFYDMGVDNKEIALREQFKGQVKVCQTSHDAMWKIINQDAQVADKYKEDFEEVYSSIVGGMLSEDALFQWLSGFNPELSPDIYLDLMKAITDERTKFKRAQDICTDVSREYITYISVKPAKWFINNDISNAKELYASGVEVTEMNLPLETVEVYDILSYKPVTSTKTENVFIEGKDDDTDLFKENQEE